ncbi:23S rRNA (uracil(747)-C(5))-methyltransferase RlmC [Curtobacterium ammoniigenes]|uniref:23S rRNA (uracil(747)-C(5))-methyltransferase RlmC n=1 Tax=Curtobacterium ammoniigenes TaxID=395387 RepID=UPI00083466DF|nr:23S rRNA (uracil(747)-C(5))-methyltransferase RlmC [Curtobacterium ammoniigenes]
MQCSYFDAGVCRSCTLMGVPYPDQILDKEIRLREMLATVGTASAAEDGTATSAPAPIDWLPAITSPESGYRNKAKMVVGGSVQHPTIGILDHKQRGVDLRACGICTPGIRRALPVLADFIAFAGLIPYDVPKRRGELKFVLVTESPSGALMVRFVLRSEGQLPTLRKHLGVLQEALPNATVITANLLPEHKAVTEGDREIVLTESDTLPMPLGRTLLHLRPQSFFQTNSTVAEQLYGQVAEWVDVANPRSLWDLYCGVGGFALHSARAGRTVLGIETSREAVASATMSARERGLPQVRFIAADATEYAVHAKPDRVPELVIVNPPRRGIGADLAAWLDTSTVQTVVYSSCNPTTLVRDLEAMPSWRVTSARMLDIFPQTDHVEVVTLVERRGA